MGIRRSRTTRNVITWLGAATLMGFLPVGATAEGHPQEVLDLIAAHDALATKIRPLKDRISTATSSAGDGGTASRVSERLRHKDRAATAATSLPAKNLDRND